MNSLKNFKWCLDIELPFSVMEGPFTVFSSVVKIGVSFIISRAVVVALLVVQSPLTQAQQFKSSHWQTFIKHLFTVNSVEKTKIKKKRPGMVHLKKFLT